MSKKNIIIVGYPKSGTSWLSRLVAELIQCEFLGDWGYDTCNESRIELQNSLSDHQVYKSHHIHNDIFNASEFKIDKIIYIIRDPRDIVISGTHFFNFSSTFITYISKILLNRSIKEIHKTKMINAVLYGNSKITPWLAIPWKDHYEGYLNKEVHFVKYEDLLGTPETECRKILSYIGLTSTSTHIEESIKNQSLEVRRKEVLELGNKNLIKLVRKGSSGYWKDEFTSKEKLLFKNKLKDVINLYNF